MNADFIYFIRVYLLNPRAKHPRPTDFYPLFCVRFVFVGSDALPTHLLPKHRVKGMYWAGEAMRS